MKELIEKLRRTVRLCTGVPGAPIDRSEVAAIGEAADILEGLNPDSVSPLKSHHVIIRTLNYLIRSHADEINWRLVRLQECAKTLNESLPFVGPGPTSYETKIRPIPFDYQTYLDTPTLEDMQRLISTILAENAAMTQLQRRKLSLFGDVDFGGEEAAEAILTKINSTER